VKVLLAHFGSVARLRAASADEIAEVRGVGPSLAAAIVGRLNGESEGQ
jgi:excinuclease ABC subunit C